MALISCPECEHSVSDKAFSCPSCGYPMNICTASGKMFSHRSICKRRKLPNGFGSTIMMVKTLGSLPACDGVFIKWIARSWSRDRIFQNL